MTTDHIGDPNVDHCPTPNNPRRGLALEGGALCIRYDHSYSPLLAVWLAVVDLSGLVDRQ